MHIDGNYYRTIWPEADAVAIIDQTRLPHRLAVARLTTLEDAAIAIADMKVRGAPLIGVTASYGLYLAMREDPGDANLDKAAARLIETRPTAVNLRWAVNNLSSLLRRTGPEHRADRAKQFADDLVEADIGLCSRIGDHGLTLIEEIAAKKPAGEPVHILTHCNAGWLATIDWGTATAPLYKARRKGLDIHVWVDETRPRNQGAALTAFELAEEDVPATVIVDNAGGHLMRRGLVDLVLVGTDRTVANGDVCNKIGTYLKALAAHDTGVPFYVGVPSPSIDWSLHDEDLIPIEERDPAEVTFIEGRTETGKTSRVRLTPDGVNAANYAFDVTPGRLVTGLITERGICPASAEGLAALFPDMSERDSA